MLLSITTTRVPAAQKLVAAYRNYCWPVESLDEFKLAPFHLLATEGGVHVGHHRWQGDVSSHLLVRCMTLTGDAIPTGGCYRSGPSC